MTQRNQPTTQDLSVDRGQQNKEQTTSLNQSLVGNDKLRSSINTARNQATQNQQQIKLISEKYKPVRQTSTNNSKSRNNSSNNKRNLGLFSKTLQHTKQPEIIPRQALYKDSVLPGSSKRSSHEPKTYNSNQSDKRTQLYQGQSHTQQNHNDINQDSKKSIQSPSEQNYNFQNQVQNHSFSQSMEEEKPASNQVDQNLLEMLDKAIDLDFFNRSQQKLNEQGEIRSGHSKSLNRIIEKNDSQQIQANRRDTSKFNSSFQNKSIGSDSNNHKDQINRDNYSFLEKMVDQSIEFNPNEMLQSDNMIANSKNDSELNDQQNNTTDLMHKNIFYSDLRVSQADGLEIENHFMMNQISQNNGNMEQYQIGHINNPPFTTPQKQNLTPVKDNTKNRERLKTPDSISQLLQEVERFQKKQDQPQLEQEQRQGISDFRDILNQDKSKSFTQIGGDIPMLTNSLKVKGIIKSMNEEQQELIGQILKQLGVEQQMRLKSEEQHLLMIDSLEENSKKLLVTQNSFGSPSQSYIKHNDIEKHLSS
ncbi:UNKNOWN [Stylonychia lemnae]|uniref:Uncharacterized protein n=1 Tax=Stylonychia lemnae TaxID=5949 RepID=A0A077ZX94_STYLE|nr:UNKNOWN [Stylonychia lemnae]|eukprot:CDW73156.1 UNKNOWN [Stylonychia lemnae]